jgi:hypothetical protein
MQCLPQRPRRSPAACASLRERSRPRRTVRHGTATRVPAHLLEQVAHARGAHAHKHLHELRAGHGEEGHAGLAGNGLGQQRLTRTGRAHLRKTVGSGRRAREAGAEVGRGWRRGWWRGAVAHGLQLQCGAWRPCVGVACGLTPVGPLTSRQPLGMRAPTAVKRSGRFRNSTICSARQKHTQSAGLLPKTGPWAEQPRTTHGAARPKGP